MSNKKKDPRSPTIIDVARAAGVSTATVSRVINHKGPAGEEIQNKVFQAINQLGYQPQRMHKRKSSLAYLAVLTEDITAPFFAEVITGINELTVEQGCLTMVINTTPRHSQKMWVLRQLKKQPLIGVISAGTYLEPDAWVEFQQEANVPVVVMNTFIDHPKIASVMVNFESATFQATQHLMDLNHTRIAYLGDYENIFSQKELRGIEHALENHGLPYPDDYRISISHTPEGASQGISRIMLMSPSQRPTALIAFDDLLAIHILNSLRHYGMRVPEDISVIGFDNIPMAAHTDPALTTIDVPKRRIGRQMVLLIGKLERHENGSIGQVLVDGSLLVRGSSGPAPSSPEE
jgi:DNA-binding LacI/PurR family transcriptional regulator